MASSFLSSGGASAIAGCAHSCASCPSFGQCSGGGGQASTGTGQSGADFFQQDFGSAQPSGSGFGLGAASMTAGFTTNDAAPVHIQTISTESGAVRLDLGGLDDFDFMPPAPRMPAAPAPEQQVTNTNEDAPVCTAVAFTIHSDRRSTVILSFFISGGLTTVEVSSASGVVISHRSTRRLRRGGAVDLADVVRGATLDLDGDVFFVSEVSHPEQVHKRRASRGATGLAALLCG